MTPKELAAILTGREIGSEITEAECWQAIDDGLVVVFGASDDLMEFRGAINDEVYAYKGTIITVDATGIVPEWERLDDRERRDIDFARDYFKREGGRKPITALWNETQGSPACEYDTAIPHETFDIMEDGETYCRGIVFSLANLGGDILATECEA